MVPNRLVQSGNKGIFFFYSALIYKESEHFFCHSSFLGTPGVATLLQGWLGQIALERVECAGVDGPKIIL